MLGVILFQRRFELGLQPVCSPELSAERAQRELSRERQMIIDEMYRHARVRNYQDFMKALAARLASVNDDRGSEALILADRVLTFSDPVACSIAARRLCAWLVRYGELAEGVEI
jgi:hypothetical protein